MPGRDILATANDQEALESEPTEPVQLALEAVSVTVQTTISNIVKTLALHCKTAFQSSRGIIPRIQSATDRWQSGERQRLLFTVVDHYYGTAIGQLGEPAQAGQRRLWTGSLVVERRPR